MQIFPACTKVRFLHGYIKGLRGEISEVYVDPGYPPTYLINILGNTTDPNIPPFVLRDGDGFQVECEDSEETV